jgi:hypothetical protein
MNGELSLGITDDSAGLFLVTTTIVTPLDSNANPGLRGPDDRMNNENNGFTIPLGDDDASNPNIGLEIDAHVEDGLVNGQPPLDALVGNADGAEPRTDGSGGSNGVDAGELAWPGSAAGRTGDGAPPSPGAGRNGGGGSDLASGDEDLLLKLPAVRFDFFPFDLRALDLAFQGFLEQVDNFGDELAQWVDSLTSDAGDAATEDRADRSGSEDQGSDSSSAGSPAAPAGSAQSAGILEEDLALPFLQALPGQPSSALAEFFPIDLRALDEAVQQLFAQAENLAEELEPGFSAWLAAIAAGAMAYEIARREMQRPLAQQVSVPECDDTCAV